MFVETNTLNQFLTEVYGFDKSILHFQEKRFINLADNYRLNFGNAQNLKFFSVPGRTEIGGNHTDHGNGRVIAAAINLDTVAAAAPNGTDVITIYSEGFDDSIKVNVNSLKKMDDELGSSTSLVRGIASALSEKGYSVKGFNAYINSSVIIGAGLSSSASFEILVATIINRLFNNNSISILDLAKAAQYAENEYFGKPCGLMDQLACASGGIISIDFKDKENPKIEKIDFNPEDFAYKLIIVNTGGNHTDLTDEYSLIPKEMESVAKILNKKSIREVSRKEFFDKLSRIRKETSDRAILRALHFINENRRTKEQIEALKNGEIENFLMLARDSGDSSFKLLQNVVSKSTTNGEGIALALALTDEFIADNKIFGVGRVHGGGFGGAIQVYLPGNYFSEYKKFIESVFGSGSVIEISIRAVGTVFS